MRSCENCGWLEVNPSGAMFCGYSEERTWKDECCTAWKDKDEPKTNADRIRSMTDEELAELFADNNCGYCRIPDFCFAKGCQINCEDAWLDWLREEAEEGE